MENTETYRKLPLHSIKLRKVGGLSAFNTSKPMAGQSSKGPADPALTTNQE